MCSSGTLYDTDEYDDATDAWTSLADIPDPERGFAGGDALTSSGRGYITGGMRSNVHGTKDCDEYDPVTNTWAGKADLPVTRNGAAVCTGSDTSLYSIGSYVNPTHYTTVYEFSMPRVPWVANLIPANEQLDVPVDSNIQFNIYDAVGVDQNTITVKVGETYAIIDGVFQPGLSFFMPDV
jgi:hypothetical protein